MAAGRPTLYSPTYPEQARKLALLGATDAQMAEIFGVCGDTIAEWKNRHPEFSEAIEAGKLAADAEIAASLYHAAKGYSHPDVDVRVIEGQIVQTEVVKHYAPDYRAASLWLRNRQPKLWREKTEAAVTVTTADKTDDELLARLASMGVKLPDQG